MNKLYNCPFCCSDDLRQGVDAVYCNRCGAKGPTATSLETKGPIVQLKFPLESVKIMSHEWMKEVMRYTATAWNHAPRTSGKQKMKMFGGRGE